jgi:hypothetical protein
LSWGAEALAVPPADGQFTYHFERTVGGGGGEYVGYHDTLRSDGSYVMLGVQGDVARFRAVYDWRYSNTEGKFESGHEDREVQFRLSDRRYLGPRTDLHEWDGKDATQLAVWFWIPPGAGNARWRAPSASLTPVIGRSAPPCNHR